VAMYSSLLQPVAARYPRSATLIVVIMDHEQWLNLHDEWLELHNRAIAGQEEWLERHNRAIEEHDRHMAEIRVEHDRDINSIRQMLRHAVQLSVREARIERRKRRELAEGLKNLQTTVDRFIDSLRRGGNGNQA
jgi:hypothetical protein